MLASLLAILTVPLAVAIVSFFVPARVAAGLTIVSGTASFGLALSLVPGAVRHDTPTYLSYLRADAVSCVFLLATAFLYAAVAVYSAGYLKGRTGQYTRRFYLGFNVFAWAMLAAPLMSSLALLWIAVEVTTVVSALLVAIENTDGAAEASWKYVLIASAGPGPRPARPDLRLLRRGAGARPALRPVHPAADRGRAPAPENPRRTGVPARGARLRHQGRPGPRAHLAARRPLGGADAGFRPAVRRAARDQLLRDPAVLPGR